MGQNVVKIPDWVEKNGEDVKKKLINEGLNSLPTDITNPEQCPICENSLDKFKLHYEYLKCKKCGYSQQLFATTSNFSKGIIFGIGIAATIYLLKKHNQGKSSDKNGDDWSNRNIH